MVDGQTLHFHLAGLNNQNFIMQDEETGTWWQQVTGEAILGPLGGKHLQLVPFDEVSAGIWKREHPSSLVLLPDEDYRSRYLTADWEEKMEKLPTAAPRDPNDPLTPRALIVGIAVDHQAKAYPMTELVKQNPVVDRVGSRALLLVLGSDGKSVRCFDRSLDREPLDLFLKPGSNPLVLVDAQTGSQWDFSGRAIGGPLAGRRLSPIQTIKDYWFDWKHYHPQTQIFSAGKLSARQ